MDSHDEHPVEDVEETGKNGVQKQALHQTDARRLALTNSPDPFAQNPDFRTFDHPPWYGSNHSILAGSSSNRSVAGRFRPLSKVLPSGLGDHR